MNRKKRKKRKKNSITCIPRFSVFFDSKATGLGRRSRLFFEPHMHGLMEKKDLEPPGSLYESFINTFYFECIDGVDIED